MTTQEQLAAFVANTRYTDLPPNVGMAAAAIFLDTVGCAMGAAPTDLGRVVQRLVDDQGGTPQATVIGTGQRTNMLLAAYANGRLANILDFDETFMMQGHHAHSVLAAALAACERAGRSGRDLITAFAVGFEVGARIGRHLQPGLVVDDTGRATAWQGLVGPAQGLYGACAAAAHGLGLGAAETAEALGLCANFLGPRSAARWQRANALGTMKYNDSGWSAHGGAMAAWQAAQGLSGLTDVFAGPDGLWRWSGNAGYDPEALTAGLGQEWWLPKTSLKPWPCCRWIHYALTAFHGLMSEEGLRPDELDEVHLFSFPAACTNPCFREQEPLGSLVQASFSAPHAVAMVALGVPSGPGWFTPQALQGESARALRRKVHLAVEEDSLNPAAWGLDQGILAVPCRAEVVARGRRWAHRGRFAMGDPWTGAPAFGPDSQVAKFCRLASAIQPGDSRWQERVATLPEAILGLAELAGVGDLTAALHPGS